MLCEQNVALALIKLAFIKKIQNMKVSPILIFLLGDSEGFVAAIADALDSNPDLYRHRLEDSFELSLERYGIKDQKASGQLVHFGYEESNYRVSVLLMKNYEPPTLVCAINEVMAQLTCETSSVPVLLAPFVVESSKLKGQERTSAASGSNVSLYGLQIGQETDITKAMAARTQKPPLSLQIHYEPLACFMQLVRILELPTFILIGQRTRSHSNQTSGGELEILQEMGELLASSTGLLFSSEKITWNPTKASKDAQEPWQALYG